MKRIEIIVKANGETKVTTSGFAGQECRDASRFLKGLGKTNNEQLTAEFHQSTNHQTLEQREGK